MGDIRLMTPYKRDERLVGAPNPTELQDKIIRLIEFYMGDYHLPFDKFIQSQMGFGGWIDAQCFLKYSTLQLLTNNAEVIAEALRQSSLRIVQVAQKGTLIRRSPDFPLPTMNDEWHRSNEERSVLCRGFPTKAPIDYEKMWNFFQANYPTPVYVKLHFDSKKFDTVVKKHFNGSVKVVFSTRQEAETFMNHRAVKFNDYTIIRMWLSDWEMENNQHFSPKVKEEPKAKRESTTNYSEVAKKEDIKVDEEMKVHEEMKVNENVAIDYLKDTVTKRDWLQFCVSINKMKLGSPSKRPRMDGSDSIDD